MSLGKAIKYGKEHRKKYYGAKAVDPACRPHGSCSWCKDGRQHKYKKAELKGKDFYE